MNGTRSKSIIVQAAGVIFLFRFNILIVIISFFKSCMFGRQPVEFEIISSNKSAHFYCFVRDVKIVRMFHKSQGLLLMIVQM